MNALISDLLETTRLETGAAALNVRSTSVRSLFAETIQAYQSLAERAGVDLAIGECAEDLVAPVDRAAMLRALGNLVDNAIRFTPAGGLVSLDARYAPGGVLLSVRDTGSGIQPEDLRHIFDRFWQAARSRGGSAGLGLAIVRMIVDQHGGSIVVESEPGRGTVFRILLREAGGPPAAGPAA